MPTLAQHYTVIVVDYRGMGSSSRPADGYDKKTMAGDLEQLVSQLGYKKVNIAGHDIGSQLAYAFAANYPASTSKVVMMDIPHSDESLLSWPLLPAHNTFGDKLDPAHPYPWWFAFHQVKGLPEKLLEGRAGLEQDWIFKYLTKYEDAITPLDRAVYARAYNSADAIRAGNAWYQSFTQDIIDDKAYARLQMPVLGIGGASSGFEWLKAVMSQKAVNFTPLKLDSGHFLPEEQPEAVASAIIDFLGKGD
jgi:pimeloyl-ACP methyl ester carboxylesterase